MTRYSACARNASLVHASLTIWAAASEPRAELVPLAAVRRGDLRVGHQRLAQAGMPGAQVAQEGLACSSLTAADDTRRDTLARALAPATVHRTEASAGELDVRLDAALPSSLSVGAGTALFVCGTCFAPAGRIASLALLVDGDEQPLMAHGMPRLDLLKASAEPASYRAGFWGLARIAPRSVRPSSSDCAPGSRAAASWSPSSRASRSPSRPRRCPARRSWRSPWRPSSRRSSCSAARSSRSARRRSPTGSAS